MLNYWVKGRSKRGARRARIRHNRRSLPGLCSVLYPWVSSQEMFTIELTMKSTDKVFRRRNTQGFIYQYTDQKNVASSNHKFDGRPVHGAYILGGCRLKEMINQWDKSTVVDRGTLTSMISLTNMSFLSSHGYRYKNRTTLSTSLYST
jgi:hypothetical protein